MSLQLKVPKLACTGCVDTVTKVVKQVEATVKVETDPKTKMVSIQTQRSAVEM